MKFNILDLLLPRETKFFVYFHEQVDILIEGCQIFRTLTSNIKTLSEDNIKYEISRIKECEMKGDGIESKIYKELNLTFITPLDREDIHLIAMTIDQAMDTLTSISNKIDIYQIHKFPKNVHNFTELIVEIAETLKKLIEDLRQKKNIELTLKIMHEIENKADYLFYLSVGDLFKKETDPIDIIKLKEVYEYLEQIVDEIDHVGKIIRRVNIKQG